MSRLQQDLIESYHRHTITTPNGDHPNMIRRILPNGKRPHIGIIGAGVAGLRCADVLTQYGAKVTILEGRDRVGGRLCQSDKLGHLVDLGPNWIHGTDDNPMLDLAKETGTVTNAWDGRQAYFDHLGHRVPDKVSAEVTELVWGVIEEAMQFSNAEAKSIPSKESLMDFFREKVKDLFHEKNVDNKISKKGDMVLKMAEMWGAFIGSPIQKQSLKFLWLEECIDGENLFVSETYHKVLSRIAQPALDNAEIKFRHKATHFATKELHGEPRIDVEVVDGETRTFDEVVVTTPLGWLKRNQDAFVPALPSRLVEAIDAIGYGHLDKVYISFPSAFWDQSISKTEEDSAVSTNPHASVPNVTATTAPLHQPSSEAKTTSKHYPGFTHWAAPTYAHETNPNKWNQECVNLAALPGKTAHPTLLFYTFGPTSQHIATLLRSSSSESAAEAAILKFLEPYYSRLPNYSAESVECKPTALLATGWANDELAGYGSYCNFQVGLERGDEDIEVMREGMPERGIWLAGEHTAPFVALGTVTGAYWAGEGVARRIASAYGLDKMEGVGKTSNGSAN
ncbi:FAD/NAD(P)-binding domain-containing protein [Lophium mytilinum]|uniref:FAD/NAD(P)-binding domain-containing protein n=1 Tax=Lophium mytilinum TaxID=390894 RepID=A0A6A6REV3_9PEZI|nr:FAD/NAD(P)-binding domain-containing protein [Lophium mytilinum]